MNKRSDLFWFEQSGVDPSSVLVYIQDKFSLNRYGKPEEVFRSIEDMGFNWVTLFYGSKNNLWYPSRTINSAVIANVELLIKAHKPVDRFEKWLKKEALRLVKRIHYWFEFFTEHNVDIQHDMIERNLENIV